MKEIIKIGELLSFDKHKFKKHLEKRRKDGIKTEAEYIEMIKDVIINYDRAFEVRRKRNKDQYNLFKSKSGWVVLFSINDFVIHSCLKMYDEFTAEDFLEFMKSADKALLDYKEVDYENNEFRRVIKEIQRSFR